MYVLLQCLLLETLVPLTYAKLFEKECFEKNNFDYSRKKKSKGTILEEKENETRKCLEEGKFFHEKCFPRRSFRQNKNVCFE